MAYCYSTDSWSNRKTAYLSSDTYQATVETVRQKGIAMATPNPNETHITPEALAKSNLAKRKGNNKIKISKGYLVILYDNVPMMEPKKVTQQTIITRFL
ncbi:hypothetical protein Tco_0349529 [Tanacetum coccineum]